MSINQALKTSENRAAAEYCHKSAKVQLREVEHKDAEQKVKQIVDSLGLSTITARILVSRGITEAADAQAFLEPSLREHLPNPSDIKNIDQAAKLLLETVEAKELITVYSDFDVDGLSSGSQLVLYLQALGGKVNHYVPNRFSEGYGLAKSAIDKLSKAGTKLLVTVDCGVTNHHELAQAKRLGMKSIVIDHHEPHGIPPADIVVDPAQDGCPFQEHKLAAAGLVWMLLIVLRTTARKRAKFKVKFKGKSLPDPKDFLDLASLGTICDMVPLTGLNRVIASRGIEALKSTQRPGLVALKEIAGVHKNPRFGAGHVGFGLGPRINAAGRLGDAKQAFELLTTKNPLRAKAIAKAIDRLNQQRKSTEEAVQEICLEQIQKTPELLSRPALALFGDDFHLGIIGIVAQRLVERFYVPTAVMAPGTITLGSDTKVVIKGSVRSIRGFHVADALQKLDSILLAHGGHAQAGGFSLELENLERFQEAFAAVAEDVLTPELLERKILADVQVTLDEVNFQLAEEISKLAPFGVGNPSPLMVTNDIIIDTVSSLANGHLRLRITDGKHYVAAVAWSFQGHPLIRKGERVNLAFHPEINSYKGLASVQLNIKQVWR